MGNRKFYIQEHSGKAFKKVHGLNPTGSHTLCGVAIEEYSRGKLLKESKTLNCPYCCNELLYFSRFLKHLNVSY